MVLGLRDGKGFVPFLTREEIMPQMVQSGDAVNSAADMLTCGHLLTALAQE